MFKDNILPIITALLSGIAVAVLSYYLNRNKTLAETNKLKADTDKAIQETEGLKRSLKDVENKQSHLLMSYNQKNSDLISQTYKEVWDSLMIIEDDLSGSMLADLSQGKQPDILVFYKVYRSIRQKMIILPGEIYTSTDKVLMRLQDKLNDFVEGYNEIMNLKGIEPNDELSRQVITLLGKLREGYSKDLDNLRAIFQQTMRDYYMGVF